MKTNIGFEDIHELARAQAIKDCASLDQANWKHTAGPGMPYSTTRKEWDSAYSTQVAIQVEITRERLRILSGHK